MALAADAATELIPSILTRIGPAQERQFFLTESTGQLQCWETLVVPAAQRGLETDSAEHSPSMMIRTHEARCRQLQRRRRQVKRPTPPTQTDIRGIHRASKMTHRLRRGVLAGFPEQHRRSPSKSEKNPRLCLLIHTELVIGRLHHLHQHHPIGEAMVWTKKNLRFKGPTGDIPAHLQWPRMKKVDPGLDLADTRPIQMELRKKKALPRKHPEVQAVSVTLAILAS